MMTPVIVQTAQFQIIKEREKIKIRKLRKKKRKVKNLHPKNKFQQRQHFPMTLMLFPQPFLESRV